MERITTYLNHRYTPYILLCAAIIYSSIEALHRGDFYVFMEAAKLMRTGGDIYTTTFADGFHYFYSPLFARILVPFSYLPFYVPKLCWLLLNIFFVYRIYKIVPHYLDISRFSSKQKTVF